MSEKLTNALLTLAGTLVTALIAAGKMPSEMAAAGWYDSLFGPVLQAILMFLGALGFQSGPTQRMMGRKEGGGDSLMGDKPGPKPTPKPPSKP